MDVACDALQAAVSLEEALELLRPAKMLPSQPDAGQEDEVADQDGKAADDAAAAAAGDADDADS